MESKRKTYNEFKIFITVFLIIEKIISLWRQIASRKKHLVIDTAVDEITDKELQNKLAAAFGTNNFMYFNPDPKQKILPEKDLRSFLSWDLTNKKKYVNIYYDCDDFAWTLLGKVREKFGSVAFGVCWYNQHAVNFWYSGEQNKVFLVEPQNDKIYEYPKKEKVVLTIL